MTPEERFAVLIRGALQEALLGGWEAHRIGLTKQAMLIGFAEVSEPIVQAIVKQVKS